MISEIVHSGPATIIQGDSETEVTCRITVTRWVVDPTSGHPRPARSRWSGDFSCASGRIDAASGTLTCLRLPGGQTHEIALRNVTINPSGLTLGEFYGRGSTPSEQESRE